MQQLPNRKSPRAEWFDYSSAGVYFVTVCTQDHEEYFGKVVDGRMILNEIGKVCDGEIQKLNHRETVDIHEWVVMPNHIHLLLCMDTRLSNGSRPNEGSATRVFNDSRRDTLMACPNDEISYPNGWSRTCVYNNSRRDASLMRPNPVSGVMCPNELPTTHMSTDSRMDVWLSNDSRRDTLMACPNDETSYPNGGSRTCVYNNSRRDASLMRPNPVSGVICPNELSPNDGAGCGADGLLNRPYAGPSLGSIIKLFKGNVKKYAQTHNIPFTRQSRYHDHIVCDEGEYNNIKRYIQNNPEKWTENKMCVKM